jgi:hypothetical protein
MTHVASRQHRPEYSSGNVRAARQASCTVAASARQADIDHGMWSSRRVTRTRTRRSVANLGRPTCCPSRTRTSDLCASERSTGSLLSCECSRYPSRRFTVICSTYFDLRLCSWLPGFSGYSPGNASQMLLSTAAGVCTDTDIQPRRRSSTQRTDRGIRSSRVQAGLASTMRMELRVSMTLTSPKRAASNRLLS